MYLWSGPGSLWWRDRFDWPILRYIWSRSGWLARPGTAAGPAGSSRWKRPLVQGGILGEAPPVQTGRSQGEPRHRCSQCSLQSHKGIKSMERVKVSACWRRTRAKQQDPIIIFMAALWLIRHPDLTVEEVSNNQSDKCVPLGSISYHTPGGRILCVCDTLSQSNPFQRHI